MPDGLLHGPPQVEILAANPLRRAEGTVEVPAVITVGVTHTGYKARLLAARTMPGLHPGSVGYSSEG